MSILGIGEALAPFELRGISKLLRTQGFFLIRAGVRAGLSATDIEASIREALGTLYRRTDFLADVRRARDEYDRARTLAGLDDEARVTRDMMTDAEPRGGLDYEYRFHVIGRDRRSGANIDRYFSIASDRVLTKGEARGELFAALAGAETYSQQIEVDQDQLDAVYSEL